MTGSVRIVIAGVEVEATYSDGKHTIPAGTLVNVVVRLTENLPRKTGRSHLVGDDHAVVGPSRCDLDTGLPTSWMVGLPPHGWISVVDWPSIEAAVTAVRNPSLVKQLVKHERLTHAAYEAECVARNLREESDVFLAKLHADRGAIERPGVPFLHGRHTYQP